MNFSAKCHNCGVTFAYDEAQIGVTLNCPGCSTEVVVNPKPAPEPPPHRPSLLDSLYPRRNAHLVDRVRESTHYPLWRLMLLVFPVLAVVNLGLTDMSVWGVGQSFSILVFWRLAVIFTDIADCLVKLAKDR